MFSNLIPATTSTTSTASNDPIAFIVVGVVVLVLFLGIVIRVLRRNRLKK